MRKQILLIVMVLIGSFGLKAQQNYETSLNNDLSFNQVLENENCETNFSNFFTISNSDLTVCYNNISQKISVSLNLKTNYYIEIYDNNFKLVFRNYFQKQNQILSTSDYKKGSYTIYVFSKGNILKRKFSI